MTGIVTDPRIVRDLIANRFDVVAARRPGLWRPLERTASSPWTPIRTIDTN